MKKIIAPALLLFFVLVAMVFAPYSPTQKITDTLGKEITSLKAALPFGFGGRILAETPCTCSGGVLLEVGPPLPAHVLYQVGISTLFSFYTLIPPEYVLGTYIPNTPLTPAVCLVGVPPACTSTPLPPFGTIVIAGTSLTPL